MRSVELEKQLLYYDSLLNEYDETNITESDANSKFLGYNKSYSSVTTTYTSISNITNSNNFIVGYVIK